MKSTIRIAFLLCAASIAATLFAAPKREKLVDRIVTGEYVLEEVMARPETAIPSQILRDAKGIILTVNYRGGFLVGGHGGHGILIAKNPLTNEWGVPAFVTTGGANIGLQVGVNEFNTIYVVMDAETMSDTYNGRFDLAADAVATAGPISGGKETRNDADYRDADILVYTNKKGLFAGVTVKAGWVAADNKATKAFYNTDYNIPEIVLSDWFELPQEAHALLQRLNYYTQGGR